MDEVKLAQLEDPATPVAAVPDLIASLPELAGERPQLRIDLTDPPTMPVALVHGIASSGVTADDAMKALGLKTAAKIRADDAAAKKAAAELAATQELVQGIADSIAEMGA